MNNYIAALDFGTQKIRVIVECNKEIVLEKNYDFPYVHQIIKRAGDKFELTKLGIKSKISEDIYIAEHEKRTPYDFYSDCFRQIFSHIGKKIESTRIGIILIVPELYSEIQRFTLKEIVEKAGFNAVKILNYSKVCAESLGLNNNSVSEVISVGADYTSFSLIKHENGITKPFDLETRSGIGGYYMDKLLFDMLASDSGINNLNISQIKSEVLIKLAREIESLKLKILSREEPAEFAFSYYDDSLKDITIDSMYIQHCLKPFYLILAELQSAILERNKNVVINRTLLSGDLTNIDTVKKALNIQSGEVIPVSYKDLLKQALKMGRGEVIVLLEKEDKAEVRKEFKSEVKDKVINEPRSTSESDDSNSDLTDLMYSRLRQLPGLLNIEAFDKAEIVLQDISSIKQLLELKVFSVAAHYYYRNNDFINAFSYIKKALKTGKNDEVVRLFENIVFMEVEKLHGLGKQREVASLLKEAKDLNPSDIIKDAFNRENRLLNTQNATYNWHRNFTPSKKKKRH